MSSTTEYTPPKVWVNKPELGRFANINRPTAGPTHEKELPSAATRCSSTLWARRTASKSP